MATWSYTPIPELRIQEMHSDTATVVKTLQYFFSVKPALLILFSSAAYKQDFVAFYSFARRIFKGKIHISSLIINEKCSLWFPYEMPLVNAYFTCIKAERGICGCCYIWQRPLLKWDKWIHFAKEKHFYHGCHLWVGSVFPYISLFFPDNFFYFSN